VPPGRTKTIPLQIGCFRKGFLPGAFSDPNLPSGYAPFGIQEVAGKIVVTYAKQDADRLDEVAHQGFGFVDAYATPATCLGGSLRAVS
jgi:hypothetical protein